MFKPLSIFIGLRYVRAKQRQHFISFISWVSLLGIAVGVAVLITVLSVMNGFDHELKTRMLGMMPHVLVMGRGEHLSDWQPIQQQLIAEPGIESVEPFVETPAMISVPGATQFVQLNGIAPHEEGHAFLTEHMVQGHLTDLVAGEFHIVLGAQLAQHLGVYPGDYVTIAVPETTLTPAGVIPRFKRFKVTGIFKVDYDYDASLAYIALGDAQLLVRFPSAAISGLQLKLDDIYQAPGLGRYIQQLFPMETRVYDWTFLNGTFFAAVKLEKTMMFLMLTLIIAVAAFNILSTLVMIVTDKRADIAILKTMGAPAGQIIRLFMVQGVTIGLLGTALGMLGGIAMATHITGWVAALEQLLGVRFISSDVYYINFLPSLLKWSDVWAVCVISFGMSLLATIYPAWRASKIHPAQALRYE